MSSLCARHCYDGGELVPKSCLILETQRAVACQDPLSIVFPRQGYCSGLPFPSPGDLPNPGIEPRFLTLQAYSLPAETQGKPQNTGVIAYLFSRGSSWSRNQTMVFCIAGGFFTTELSGKPSHCYTYSLQFHSVAQSCLTLSAPMDCSMPGFPVHHQLPELAQTHAHGVSDDIQSSHPLSSPYPPT